MTKSGDKIGTVESIDKEKPPTIVCQWCWRKIEGIPILKYMKYPPSKKLVYDLIFCTQECIEACKANGYVELEGDELARHIYRQNVQAFFIQHFAWPEKNARLKFFYSSWLQDNRKIIVLEDLK